MIPWKDTVSHFLPRIEQRKKNLKKLIEHQLSSYKDLNVCVALEYSLECGYHQFYINFEEDHHNTHVVNADEWNYATLCIQDWFSQKLSQDNLNIKDKDDTPNMCFNAGRLWISIPENVLLDFQHIYGNTDVGSNLVYFTGINLKTLWQDVNKEIFHSLSLNKELVVIITHYLFGIKYI